MTKLLPVIVAVALLAVVIAAVMLTMQTETDSVISPTPPAETIVPPVKDPVYCTQDAKLCPDGSYVGRTGPKCEFTPCPGIK
jgi:hypothetical protein